MEIAEFAEKDRLRTRRDGYGDSVIPGKRTVAGLPERVEYRNHIFDNGDGRLGVCLLFPTKARWTYAKKKLVAAGFTIQQNGDEEGTALFDPADARQARLAVRITGAKPKRILSPEQLAARMAALARARIARNARQDSPTLL